jgi:hypothetical protein
MRQRQRATRPHGDRTAEIDSSLSTTEGDTPSGSPGHREDIKEMTKRSRRA